MLLVRWCPLFVLAGDFFAQQYLISTVAGGAPPPTPAPATSASVYPPAGAAVDSAGNLFFTSDNRVFQVDRNGVLARVAGIPCRAFRRRRTGCRRCIEPSERLNG